MTKLTQQELQERFRAGTVFERYMPFTDQWLCEYGSWHDPLEECACKDKEVS